MTELTEEYSAIFLRALRDIKGTANFKLYDMFSKVTIQLTVDKETDMTVFIKQLQEGGFTVKWDDDATLSITLKEKTAYPETIDKPSRYPTIGEQQISRLFVIRDVVDRKQPFNEKHWDGYHPEVFDKSSTISIEDRDRWYQETITRLRTITIAEFQQYPHVIYRWFLYYTSRDQIRDDMMPYFRDF